ncbi:methylated-DNA--[protein]-cysteine S-methyltransferase [Palleronia sp. KMU-117]|uniref:methylated-DNA--[protein]-cysteine S-methyltransferase n=1 Tax=Palleronia sp. KMU-117 TaxID=3434108 RepID=UPI003D72B38E
MTTMTTPEDSYYYKLMRRAIDRIDAEDGRELRLEDLAAEMNLSPAHFQRIFSRWAGVSPKRFQQWLTLEHARRLLAERHTTLETADAVGLSGSGRLHDLFLRWEAMSPGDYARAGAGLTIRWAWVDSPFGPALLMGTDRGICGIGFAAETGADATMADMRARWPKATFVEDPATIGPLAGQAFPKVAGAGKAPLFLIGAPFQIKVWEALLQIPTGHVTTYSDIAQAIGHPQAVRAVGTAVGRNPVSWLIPCHRALRKSGGLGGYHWGLPVKRAMLAWEAAETA